MMPPLLLVVVAALDCSLVPASSTSWTMYSLSFCSFSCVLTVASSRTAGRKNAVSAVFARQVGGAIGDSQTGSRASAARLRWSYEVLVSPCLVDESILVVSPFHPVKGLSGTRCGRVVGGLRGQMQAYEVTEAQTRRRCSPRPATSESSECTEVNERTRRQLCFHRSRESFRTVR